VFVLFLSQTKTLTAEKTKNEAKQTEEALRVQQAEDRLRSSDSTAKVATQFESISRQLATLNEELDAFEALRKEIEQVRAERRETEKETAQLAKSKDEQQDKIKNGQSNYEASSRLLEQAKAAQSRVEAEREANDKVQAEDVLPGQIERNSLMEEKQELARTMNTLHEALVAFDSKHSKDLTDQSEVLKELEEDYKLVSDGLAEKHSLAESIKYIKEQADAFAEKEQQEHEQFRTKFEEAVAAETKRLEEIKSERKKKRCERVEEARIKSSRMRSGLEVNLEVLLLGVDEIAKVEHAAQ
jgi:DNA repair exonuclease SbcCD ATPase subunit